MPIVWRPQMSVGNDLIDAEHRVVLLRDWILNHVLTTDLRMKPFLARLPRNFAAT